MPFEQTFGWSGLWDDLPAAHAAAIAFDLLAVGLLFLLGRRIGGPTLAVALSYAWVSYPFTLYALESNSNDTLVAVLLLAALLVATSAARARGVRRAGGPHEDRPAGARAALRHARPAGAAGRAAPASAGAVRARVLRHRRARLDPRARARLAARDLRAHRRLPVTTAARPSRCGGSTAAWRGGRRSCRSARSCLPWRLLWSRAGPAYPRSPRPPPRS